MHTGNLHHGKPIPMLYSTQTETSDLVKYLKTKMRMSGPLTVSDYMKAILTHPGSGYYMHHDVFGVKGDFTTSPEISQMFGELLGVWCVNEWLQNGAPSRVNVVELGPGRGTLADDMLRVFAQFKDIQNAVSLHLVEISPKLSEIQQVKLQGGAVGQTEGVSHTASQEGHHHHCVSRYGTHVFWYRDLKEVPKEFSIFIAHEFFDALPVHKFQKSENGWCEVCVDIDHNAESEKPFRFIISRGPTIASSTILEVDPTDKRDHIEVCPEGGAIAQEIAQRIVGQGGAALIADYGHLGEKTDTFRGFKDHKVHDVLVDPGTADLTADVDFSYLRKVVGNQVKCHGPVTQETFLHNMGIGLRLQVLLERADTALRKDLITGYDMLTNPHKMGERFKFLAFTQHKDQDYSPAGFIKPS
ncbi:protein arginine methyltransferase NDUFAF7, mitochondrial-like isoform X2 [Liolophura sinensis]|uniref:protein arginine methyltransferase NDUFAF7, mitochondrial-like isoform X2 n=1 Tax=Liolophura sinensis TaxID=3198878 RepID=UPI003158FB18